MPCQVVCSHVFHDNTMRWIYQGTKITINFFLANQVHHKSMQKITGQNSHYKRLLPDMKIPKTIFWDKEHAISGKEHRHIDGRQHRQSTFLQGVFSSINLCVNTLYSNPIYFQS